MHTSTGSCPTSETAQGVRVSSLHDVLRYRAVQARLEETASDPAFVHARESALRHGKMLLPFADHASAGIEPSRYPVGRIGSKLVRIQAAGAGVRNPNRRQRYAHFPLSGKMLIGIDASVLISDLPDEEPRTFVVPSKVAREKMRVLGRAALTVSIPARVRQPRTGSFARRIARLEDAWHLFE